MLPPITRMFAFMPEATPVCSGGTAATISPADRTIGIPAKPDQWRRNVAVILDGMRAAPGR